MTAERYFVQTFGCRVNQADTAGLAHELDLANMVRTDSFRDADVVVLNTCTVTHRSDTDVRKTVNRIQRENPEARVLVAGCYAQRDPEAVARLSGVHAVVGNAHRARLPVLAQTAAADAPIVVHSEMDSLAPEDLPPVDPVTTVLDRTRPFIKIQDGCDAHCTYCIIPAVRGQARSAAPERVVNAVQTLVDDGYVEVVLAGIHLGTYGAGLDHPVGLDDLVRQVLDIDDLIRLRLSCIEPMAFPMALADIAAEDHRLAPHFHLPLQSGSDAVLKRMVRPYRAQEFQALLDGILTRVPDACLGTDVIVGFPGETDEDFAETCRFIEASGLHYVHVFSYSDRSGTPSTRLDKKVDPRIIKERSQALHVLSDHLHHAYLDRQIGHTRAAVTLERDAKNPGTIVALTDNYANVAIEDATLTPNQDIRVRITGRRGKRLLGQAA